MEELIGKVSLSLVSRLLSGRFETVTVSKAKEAWIYPETISTYHVDPSRFESEELSLLRDLNLVMTTIASPDQRTGLQSHVNPRRIDVLKDLELHYKVARSIAIIESQKEND